MWFRRDLRVHDHPALTRAVEEFDHVVCVFVLDDALLRGRYRSDARTRFMLGCLEDLDASLRERGSALTVLHGRPEVELAKLDVDAVLFSADVSPYARARDERIANGIAVEGTYVIDLDDIEPRKVFSPWQRAWSSLPRRHVLPAPRAIPSPEPAMGSDPSPEKVGRGLTPPQNWGWAEIKIAAPAMVRNIAATGEARAVATAAVPASFVRPRAAARTAAMPSAAPSVNGTRPLATLARIPGTKRRPAVRPASAVNAAVAAIALRPARTRSPRSAPSGGARML